MGRKDSLTKEYMSRNDIFEDVFNYILFDGNMVIQPKDLMEKDITEIALPIEKDGKMVPIQRYRDILKGAIFKERGETVYALLGIENQSEPHYAMPVKTCCTMRSTMFPRSVKNQQNIERNEKNTRKLIIPKEIQDFDKFHSEFGYLMQIIGASDDATEMNHLFSRMRDKKQLSECTQEEWILT